MSVKPALTTDRPYPSTEVDEYGRFVRRVLRAYSRRVGDRDIEGLRGLAALREEIDIEIASAVAGLRASGYSWGAIAKSLGISRQAAWEHYADRDECV